MALHLPIEFLKTRSGLKPIPRYEPSDYQPIRRRHSHCAIGAGKMKLRGVPGVLARAFVSGW